MPQTPDKRKLKHALGAGILTALCVEVLGHQGRKLSRDFEVTSRRENSSRCRCPSSRGERSLDGTEAPGHAVEVPLVCDISRVFVSISLLFPYVHSCRFIQTYFTCVYPHTYMHAYTHTQVCMYVCLVFMSFNIVVLCLWVPDRNRWQVGVSCCNQGAPRTSTVYSVFMPCYLIGHPSCNPR